MPKTNPEKYIGQTCMMKCGLKATVIAYRHSHDIDVQFENGTIITHTSTSNFNDGKIRYAQNKANEYIGKTNMMTCGMKATVIAYRNHNDIDIQFEDGTVREHMRIGNFRKGSIRPTPYGRKIHYVGRTNTMNCGLKATIIEYRNSRDITVQFENGNIREHVSMTSFRIGEIAPTPYNLKTNYIGKTMTMNCGLNATIIAYRNSDDIDVQFENGIIREHMKIAHFNRKVIALSHSHKKTKYIGETNTMNCGMKAMIIKYRSNKDIDIQFEDGTIREHMVKTAFSKGQIAHPTNILFDTYKLDKIAFQFHDKTYFYVTYTENNSEISEVMCIDDMKQKLPALSQ